MSCMLLLFSDIHRFQVRVHFYSLVYFYSWPERLILLGLTR